MDYFPLMTYQKKFFFFYIMYFLLYNPNLKSVFFLRSNLQIRFFSFFFFFFYVFLDCLFGYFRIG